MKIYLCTRTYRVEAESEPDAIDVLREGNEIKFLQDENQTEAEQEDCPKKGVSMSKYSLKKDHALIKAQIKEWERKIDDVMESNDYYIKEIYVLEEISQEMMAINI